MATAPNHGRLRVSWRPVESEKLGELLGGTIADVGLTGPDVTTLAAESHVARARRIVAETPTDAIDRALLLFGAPQVLGATSASAEAEALLRDAAKIEHALMVQYLYAGFSAINATGFEPGVELRRIAIEEMGHLLTVTNLALALGGEPYFGRQDQDPAPAYDPYPFTLERLSLASLGKYVAAEAPEPKDLEDETERKTLERISSEAAGGIKEGVIHRVGLLYLRLFFLFQENDNATAPWTAAARAKDWGPAWHVDETDISQEKLGRQMAGGFWKSEDKEFLGLAAKTRKEVREAIYAVAAQGEGSAPAHLSHFRRLFRLYQHVENTSVPLEKLSRPFPALSGAIFDEPARSLSQLFDARYELLLINLQQAFLYASEAEARLCRDWCLEEMKNIIPILLRLIVKQPQKAGGNPKLDPAAPFFHLPDTPVPLEAAALCTRMTVAIETSTKCIASAMAAGIAESDVFEAIKELDERRTSEAKLICS
ncbi:ferritin-like domain-containing protein [Bradyrhizobium sp.]|jgi:hypothetical protein|uniref:ferritin-like domain-containing protein n=1 Tax=Bradyrhizobium sp. TaxID=376 RepID=UPI002E038462|nr:ferritin-like domain-containing protein [Bradyrhizobium sp.]